MNGLSSPDRTVLDIAPLRKTLPLAASVLVVLFVAVDPSASAGLGIPGRAAFWTLHIGVGLAGILVASLVVRQGVFTRRHAALAVLATGLIGALVVAPLYLVIESIFPVASTEVPDDALDRFAARSTGHAVVAEYLEVVPAFVAAWIAINVPLLLTGRRRDGRDGNGGGPPGRGGIRSEAEAPDEVSDPGRAAFIASLPTAIGSDIVSISSDLHYLHVHTSGGRTMILGNLRDAAAALGDEGLVVHRSHWVSKRHVVRFVVTGQRAICEMSNGRKVPVSRRRRKDARAAFGAPGPVRIASVR